MQLTIDIGYDQLFELVRQLPAREKERLFQESQCQESQSSTTQFSTVIPKLSAEEIEQRRQEALRLALECPIATPEEIEAYNEFRSRFRCRQK